ncbi:aldo/keto reductase [Streptomyces zhihengii]|uniref:Aldo/keto reductase n=1 Tax=Streptomyces zhihengii TaxID=1818004 RepID=A0ABS2UJ68_9ACTN|nr:aldo/keto reductase [Streptomyces zhihengii]MBM9617602.1 aldo/keto reductase [Streptomyces zhihengii]
MRADDLVPLGRTGLRVSRLGLGLASVGGLFAPVTEARAAAVLERAWDLGIRLYDTAPVYGYGLSERRTGAALGGRDRDAFVLCTKVGRLIEPGGPDTQPIWADPPPGVGPRKDYSYAGVLRSVAESLERLGMDRVDVLHVHDPDEEFGTAVGEAYRALADLRERGTIGAVSIGVNHAPVAARFLRRAAAPGPDCVLLAGRYGLLDQSGLDELLPLCTERGVAVLAAGVYHGGLLAEPGPGTPHAHAPVEPGTAARIAGWRELCGRYGVPLLAAAVRFPFGHPAVAAVVVGARTAAEVEQSAAWLAHPVPAELWAEARRSGLLRAGCPGPPPG